MLKGKNAVITGANRGIGRAVVEQFALCGCNIWACARKKDEVFDQDMKQLSNRFGVWIQPIYFDLGDEQSIKAGMKEIMGKKQPIHILTNVAGITHNALFHMTTPSIMRQVLEIDFVAQMIISQYITKLMLRNGGGSVVNVSSFIGLNGNPGQLAYSAAKGALIAATKTMAAELGEKGIRVNAVAPGVIDTDMTRVLTEEQRTALKGPTAISRLGTPEEVAAAIAFLASDGASYITGQVLSIDGGRF